MSHRLLTRSLWSLGVARRRTVVVISVGPLIALLIGSSLIRTAQTAQLKFPPSFRQDQAGAGASPGGAETPALAPGRSIEREISSGQAHTYQIRLDAGKYLHVQVEQRGIDVTVALLAPDGKTIAESKSDNGNFGPETVSMVAEEPAELRLEVCSPGWEAPAGRYEVKIADLRTATEEDRKRVDAERAFAEGMRLSRQGAAESIRRSLAKYETALQIYKSLGDRGGGAASFNRIGRVYDLMSERRKALDSFNQALRLYQSLGDRGGEAAALDNVCWSQYQIGERKKALDCFDRALELSRRAGDRLAESLILRDIGSVYAARGEKQKALDYFDQALRLNGIVGPRNDAAAILNKIGAVYNLTGEKRKALAHFQEAQRIFHSVCDLRGEAFALANIALVYSSLGEPHKTLDYYKQSLPLVRLMGDRAVEAAILNNIGNVYTDLGEMQEALEHHYQSLLIRRETRDRGGEAISLNSLGSLYELLGERQKAIDFYNESLTVMREFNHRAGEAAILVNIGKIHRVAGENQEAIDAFNTALAIEREIDDRRGEAITLTSIGLVYAQMGDNRKALERFEQALSLQRGLSDPEGLAATLYSIGLVRLSLGESKAALEAFDESLRLWRTSGVRAREAIALEGMARAERDRGNLAEALGKIDAALKIVESLRAKIGEGDLRASYLGATQSCYELYIDLLMQAHRLDPSKNHAAAAFQMSERSRARALIETLAASRAEIRNGIDPALLASERELRQRLESKNDRLIRLLGGMRAEEQAAARSEIESLEIEYQRLQSQIRAARPRYADLTQPRPLSLAEIQQQAIDDDALLLEYALGGERSYLWAVTKTSITSRELPPRKEIEQATRRVRELLTARNQIVRFEAADERQVRIAQADAEYPNAAAALSQMLLGPVADQLGKKRLLIVADGALQYAPFAALPKPAVPAAGGKATADRQPPLVVDHEIVNLPSASALVALRRELAGRKPAPKTVAVLADPVFDPGDERFKASAVSPGTGRVTAAQSRTASAALESDLSRSARDLGLGDVRGGLRRLPFTRKEAQTILSLAPPDQRFVALDFAANQTTATSDELAQYRYIHFATHGLLNPQRPELSGIVLSLFNEQGAEQDGFLLASEVYNLNLPAELVVLSGCQTALGKDIRGEGVIGLTRGFMYAGAARALVSLWEVNDHATSELMGRLYRGMLGKRRLSPAAALREAQLSLWREKRWQAPYYWAGFTLQGEPR